LVCLLKEGLGQASTNPQNKIRSHMVIHRGSHAKGFSLLELMVALAIAGVIAGVAIPSFANMLKSGDLGSTTFKLSSSLRFAKSESIKGYNRIIICPRDGEQCGDNSAWVNGWLVFNDNDRNGLYDNDDTLHRRVAIEPHIKLSSNSDEIVFEAGKTEVASFEVCYEDASGNKSRIIKIKPVGANHVISAEDCS